MPLRPPRHGHPTLRDKSQRDRAHDQRRGSSRDRGYTSEWERARQLYLAEHPLCAMCERERRFMPATVVDHIQPHRGDRELFWNENNWQALCKRHHDRDKQREERTTTREDVRKLYPIPIECDERQIESCHTDGDAKRHPAKWFATARAR